MGEMTERHIFKSYDEELEQLHRIVMQMGELVREQIQLAIEVMRMNKEIEDFFKSDLRRLSTFIMEDSRNVGHIADVVLGLRALERFGGHAKNIAGHVIFLVKDQDVRHEALPVVELEIRR